MNAFKRIESINKTYMHRYFSLLYYIFPPYGNGSQLKTLFSICNGVNLIGLLFAGRELGLIHWEHGGVLPSEGELLRREQPPLAVGLPQVDCVQSSVSVESANDGHRIAELDALGIANGPRESRT